MHVPMEDRRGGLELEQRGDRTRPSLLLGGELGIASAPRLQDAITRLCAQGASALTLDLSRLVLIDSSGLAAIVYASRLCERDGCELTLVPGPASVQRVFEISGLAPLLPFRSRAASDGTRDAASDAASEAASDAA